MGLSRDQLLQRDRPPLPFPPVPMVVGLNRYQLLQLWRLDPEAYQAAMVGVKGGFVALPNQIIVEAMRAALTRLSQNGQGSPDANGNGSCYNKGAANIPPPPGEVLYDLVIASKKYGYGSTTHAEAPILWWKLAGQAQEAPPYRMSLVDRGVAERLRGYELMDTEVHRDQVVRKYRKVGEIVCQK